VQIVRVRDRQTVLWPDYWNPLAAAQLLGRLPDLPASYSTDEQ